MSVKPARLKLRRRLLIYSALPAVVGLLIAIKLISVVVAGNSAVTAFETGNGNALREDAAILGVANLVEPAKAPFTAGVAAVLQGRLDDADIQFLAALAHTDAAHSCPVRVNLELVRETQGDQAASARDRSRAEERYASAASIVDDAPRDCFAGNSDPDLQRQAIRHDAANRLAAKRSALNAPPSALPPPLPPPLVAPPAPPPLVITPDGRQIPARQLDPDEGDPLDKLLQVLEDAAGAAPPGE
ncbi:hypothetical protein A5634_12015 [Mycobacterium asiaticum]|uniref:Uncharacterized protein n=1 Tax=Mycobacterium asiaticum TaxID=1790 RepID=A0A1A3NI18_MYCAS|nr:hypothetical protein [Mycobacterium asiaticum]OBK20704.1 hypothetical protein A5634_12015 [Mycobacterium asiaticum]